MLDSFEKFVALRPKNYDDYSFHKYQEAEVKKLSDAIPAMPDELVVLSSSKTWQQGSDKLVPPYTFLSLRKCVAEYQRQLELDKEALAFESDEDCLVHRGYLEDCAKPDGAIKIDRRWRPKWIPLTTGEQQGHFLDFDPGENGKAGQVVRYDTPSFSVRVEGTSLEDWFNRLTIYSKAPDAQDDDDILFLLPAITEAV